MLNTCSHLHDPNPDPTHFTWRLAVVLCRVVLFITSSTSRETTLFETKALLELLLILVVELVSLWKRYAFSCQKHRQTNQIVPTNRPPSWLTEQLTERWTLVIVWSKLTAGQTVVQHVIAHARRLTTRSDMCNALLVIHTLAWVSVAS